MIENERRQRMVERVREDERLRGDLPDEAAVALVEWASQRAAAAAADPTCPDAAVAAEVQGIRAAARVAARAGETDPRRLLALAETKLAQRRVSATPLAIAPAAPPILAAHLAAELGASSAVGAVAARAQPPTASPPSEPAASAQQIPAPSRAERPLPEQKPPSARRWNPFASFLNRIRGDR